MPRRGATLMMWRKSSRKSGPVVSLRHCRSSMRSTTCSSNDCSLRNCARAIRFRSSSASAAVGTNSRRAAARIQASRSLISKSRAPSREYSRWAARWSTEQAPLPRPRRARTLLVMQLHVEVEGNAAMPLAIPGGGAEFVAFISFANSRGFGAQHPYIALADRLHDAFGVSLGAADDLLRSWRRG